MKRGATTGAKPVPRVTKTVAAAQPREVGFGHDQAKARRLIEGAERLEIANVPAAQAAHAQMKEIKVVINDIDTRYQSVRRPIAQGLNTLKQERDQAAEPLERVHTLLRGKLNTWEWQQRDVERQQQEAHRQQVQEAEQAGAPVEDVPLPPTPAPSLPTTTLRKWEVMDEAKIPYMFGGTKLWMLDEVAIRKIRLEYGDQPSPIPGIEFYSETTVVGR